MKTLYVKSEDTDRKWYIIDATDKILGRVAEKAARFLAGKHKACYHPSVECGDYIVVINASKIKVTGKKLQDKNYYRHTNYPGGLKTEKLGKLLEKDPAKVILLAVKGMLPGNKLGRKLLKNIRVYADDKHEQQAQKPEALEI